MSSRRVPVAIRAGGEALKRLERQSDRCHALQRDRSFDFVYGGEERQESFRRIVGGPGKDVLDLGCRYGALTRSYLRGNFVVGVDVDRSALAVAARRGIDTRWLDVEHGLPFGDETFDVVVAGEVLEHIRDPLALLEEAGRVLRPGGTLVGSVPNAFRLKNRLRFLVGSDPENNAAHLHRFSPSMLLALLATFDQPRISFISSRFRRLHPRLMANIVVFAATKPDAANHRSKDELGGRHEPVRLARSEADPPEPRCESFEPEAEPVSERAVDVRLP